MPTFFTRPPTLRHTVPASCRGKQNRRLPVGESSHSCARAPARATLHCLHCGQPIVNSQVPRLAAVKSAHLPHINILWSHPPRPTLPYLPVCLPNYLTFRQVARCSCPASCLPKTPPAHSLKSTCHKSSAVVMLLSFSPSLLQPHRQPPLSLPSSFRRSLCSLGQRTCYDPPPVLAQAALLPMFPSHASQWCLGPLSYHTNNSTPSTTPPT